MENNRGKYYTIDEKVKDVHFFYNVMIINATDFRFTRTYAIRAFHKSQRKTTEASIIL